MMGQTAMDNKKLPYDLKAEESLLGAVIINYKLIEELGLLLSPDAFYSPENSIIWQSITKMIDNKKPVDLVTLNGYLLQNDLLSSSVAYSYLMDLTDSVPTFANLNEYVKTIQELYSKRQYINAAYKLIEMAYNPDMTPEQIAELHEQEVFKIAHVSTQEHFTHIGDIVRKEWEETEQAYENGIENYVDKSRVSTGLRDLDERVQVSNSDLIIIGARPAMGKTSFAINMGTNIAKKTKKPIAVFSLEMSKDQIGKRIISSETGTGLYNIKAKKIENLDGYVKELMNVAEYPIYIDDSGSIDPVQIKARTRKLKSKIKDLGAVVIDYLQLMDSDKNEDIRKQLARYTRQLKIMARELDIPVFVLSQLSRSLEQRQNKRPQLSDLKESGSIEADADIVMFVYRDEYYNPESADRRIGEIIVAKNRSGSTGTVRLYFDANTTTFKNLEGDYIGDRAAFGF